jgi:hypothetical protein
MKKMLLMGFALMVAAAGCKSKSPTGTKLDQKAERRMDGTWTLTSVTNPMSDMVKISSFQIADSNCFEGSTWKLVAGNNKGDLRLNTTQSDCPAFSSPISWYINKNSQFVLKVLDDKARRVREGFVLNVANQTDRSFELIDMVDVGGRMANITYRFEKQ